MLVALDRAERHLPEPRRAAGTVAAMAVTAVPTRMAELVAVLLTSGWEAVPLLIVFWLPAVAAALDMAPRKTQLPVAWAVRPAVLKVMFQVHILAVWAVLLLKAVVVQLVLKAILARLVLEDKAEVPIPPLAVRMAAAVAAAATTVAAALAAALRMQEPAAAVAATWLPA